MNFMSFQEPSSLRFCSFQRAGCLHQLIAPPAPSHKKIHLVSVDMNVQIRMLKLLFFSIKDLVPPSFLPVQYAKYLH